MPVIVNHYITHSCLANIINATLIKMLSLKLLMVLLMLTFEVSVEESVGDRPVAAGQLTFDSLATVWNCMAATWSMHSKLIVVVDAVSLDKALKPQVLCACDNVSFMEFLTFRNSETCHL